MQNLKKQIMWCLELWEVTPPLNSIQYLWKIKYVYATVFIKQAENTVRRKSASWAQTACRALKMQKTKRHLASSEQWATHTLTCKARAHYTKKQYLLSIWQYMCSDKCVRSREKKTQTCIIMLSLLDTQMNRQTKTTNKQTADWHNGCHRNSKTIQ